jgi:prevent-host-death family protein
MTGDDPLPISEARKHLSQLVERVARGGRAVAIGRYGRERAWLVSVEEYARLQTPRDPIKRSRTLAGTLSLTCSPQDLIAESRRLGELWNAVCDDSLLDLEPLSFRPRKASRAK